MKSRRGSTNKRTSKVDILLGKRLQKESKIVRKHSLKTLMEFEKFK